MGAIISLLVVIVLSLLVTRVATVALTLTGMSEEVARFQARSAFTGCGFSTRESEQVMNHPVRRRILMVLMLLGNAGIVTAVSSLVLAFVSAAGHEQLLLRLGVFAIGLAVLSAVGSSAYMQRQMSRAIRWAIQKWTRLDVQDYASLLRLANDYTVCEMEVQEDDWVANRTLAELQLNREGVTVLGVQRAEGDFLGVVTGETLIRPRDVLILYGRLDSLDELDKRRTGAGGDRAHREAILQAETQRAQAAQAGQAEQRRDAASDA